VIDLDVPRRVIRVVLTVYRSFLVCPDKQIPQSPWERLEGGRGEVIPTRRETAMVRPSSEALLSQFPV